MKTEIFIFSFGYFRSIRFVSVTGAAYHLRSVRNTSLIALLYTFNSQRRRLSIFTETYKVLFTAVKEQKFSLFSFQTLGLRLVCPSDVMEIASHRRQREISQPLSMYGGEPHGRTVQANERSMMYFFVSSGSSDTGRSTCDFGLDHLIMCHGREIKTLNPLKDLTQTLIRSVNKKSEVLYGTLFIQTAYCFSIDFNKSVQ